MRIDTREAGAFINLVRSHAPRSWVAYTLIGIVLMVFQTSFIISEELGAIYLSYEEDPMKRGGTILASGSVFNSISGFFDPKLFFRSLQSSHALIIFAAVAFVEIILCFSFWRFGTIRRILRISKRQKCFAMYFISNIFLNYDFFFFLLNVMAINGMTCHIIYVEEVKSSGTNYIEDEGFDGSEYFDTLNRYNLKKLIPSNVTSINNNIECLGTNHLLLITFSLAIILGNIAIKLISSRIIKLNPSNDLFLSKVGDIDVIQDLILLIIITSNSLIITFASESYLIYRILFYLYLILLGAVFILNFTYRPFLNSFQHNLKSFQLLYLILLTFSSILTREADLSITRSETSMILFMIVGLTILLKINLNLSRMNKSRIFEEIMKLKKFNQKNIILIYYLVLEWIDNSFNNRNIKDFKDIDSEGDIMIFIKYFFIEHRKKCSEAVCFCKEDKLFKHRHRLSFFKNNGIEWSSFEILLLIEKLLKSSYLISNRQNKNIFYCYLYFQINYLGKAYEAYNQLIAAIMSRRGSLRDLTIEEGAVLDEIERAMGDNMTSSYLCLRKFPEIINEISNEGNGSSFAQHIDFLNRLQRFKSQISKIVEERTKFLREIQTSGNLKRLYDYSSTFYDLSKKLIYTYQKLYLSTDGDFGPLLLLYSWFMHSIYQNKQIAAKIMGEYTRKYNKHNLNKIFGGPESLSQEFACVYVGQHKTSKHVIKYCTSNILTRLGYIFSELEHKDLGVIIPQPIRSFHSKFFDDDQFGGQKLMKKSPYDVYTIDRNGYLVYCELTIRFNPTILSGLQIVGILQFPQTQKVERLAIIDRSGLITAIADTAKHIFSPNSNLSCYNKKFNSVIESFEKVAVEKLALRDNNFDYDYFFMGNIFTDWIEYYEWKKSRNINLLTNSHKVEKFNITIEEKLVFTVLQFYYILRVEKSNTQEEIVNKTRASSKNRESKMNLIDFITERTIQDKLNPKSSRISSAGYKSEESIPEEIEVRINETRVFIKPDSDILFDSNDKIRKDEVDIKKMCRSKEFRSQAQNESSLISKKRENRNSGLSKIHPLAYMKKRSILGAKEERLNKISEMRNVLSKNIIKAKDKRQHASHKSSGSSISFYSQKDITLEKVIHDHIDPGKLHFSTILISLIIFVLCLLNIGSVVIKVPIQQETNSDLKEQLITADVFSWGIWAQIYPILYLDIKRNAKEGLIPIDIAADYGFPDIILSSDIKFQKAVSYQYIADTTIDMKIRNVSFPSLLDVDSWIHTQAITYFFEFDYTKKAITWQQIPLQRKVMLQMMTSFAKDFSKRNYSIPEGEEGYIPLIRGNRDADPDEEFFRKNLNGDINHMYFLRSLDFYEYLKNVGRQNEKYVLYTMIGTFSITCVLYLAIYLYLFQDLIFMRKFYGSIFAIQVI